MNLRRFNESGVKQFGAYLEQLKSDPKLAPPRWLLADAAVTEEIDLPTSIKHQAFDNRLDAARFVDDLISRSGLSGVERDTGLWAWLSLFLFDEVCPADKHGERDPGEFSSGVFVRLVPAIGNFQKYYRHLLLGPYLIYRAHSDNPERALSLLAAPVHKPGEVVGQIAAYQELVTNRAVVAAATELYVDPATKKLKRGASGKDKGAPRRLVSVLNQFDLTWDLYAMEQAQILGLLPEEFKRFKKTSPKMQSKMGSTATGGVTASAP